MTLHATLKSLIPRRLRILCKPLYEKVLLRNFYKPCVVNVRHATRSFFIKLDPQNGAVDRYIYIHKNWEPDIAAVVVRELKLGEVFLDVGANIGYFSLLAAQIVGKTGKVIAFEPMERLFLQIQDSVEINKYDTVEVANYACGDKQMVTTLHIPQHNLGGSSLVKHIDSVQTESVNVTTIDHYTRDLSHVDVIKIDVEGFEYEALRGAVRCIEKHVPKIILEFNPSAYAAISVNRAEDLLVFLKERHYRIYDIDGARTVHDIHQFLTETGMRQKNLFCVAEGNQR